MATKFGYKRDAVRVKAMVINNCINFLFNYQT